MDAATKPPSMVVDQVMMVATHQHEIVDVGWPPTRWLPRLDVVGFAPFRRLVADNATLVSDHQCTDLCVGGGANLPSVPQGLTIAREDHAHQLGVARQA